LAVDASGPGGVHGIVTLRFFEEERLGTVRAVSRYRDDGCLAIGSPAGKVDG
jgi:hypothetical protein